MCFMVKIIFALSLLGLFTVFGQMMTDYQSGYVKSISIGVSIKKNILTGILLNNEIFF